MTPAPAQISELLAAVPAEPPEPVRSTHGRYGPVLWEYKGEMSPAPVMQYHADQLARHDAQLRVAYEYLRRFGEHSERCREKRFMDESDECICDFDAVLAAIKPVTP